MRTLLFVPLLATRASAHGAMTSPPVWFDPLGLLAKTSPTPWVGGAMWFTNHTFIPGEPTIADDSALLTYPHNLQPSTPWRAPGTAPVNSACGTGGGNPTGCPAGDPSGSDCPGGGYGWGPDAVDLFRAGNFSHASTTRWFAGDVVEVEWGIQANHGGGYAYRLCRADADLSEGCFQRTPLPFVGDTQWASYGSGAGVERVAFRANRTDDGLWTKDPVPACAHYGGGVYEPAGDACSRYDARARSTTQFAPPAPGLEGFGEAYPGYEPAFNFTIVDLVHVPADLEPGLYVLSFRWDCEQTPQVWLTCANIRIEALVG